MEIINFRICFRHQPLNPMFQVNPQPHLNCRLLFYFLFRLLVGECLFFKLDGETLELFFDELLHLHAVFEFIFSYKFVQEVESLFLLMIFFLFILVLFTNEFLLLNFLLKKGCCQLFFDELNVLVILNFIVKITFQIIIYPSYLFFLIF